MKLSIEFDNSEVVANLQHYCFLSDALEEYPFLEDIVTGVCHLDLGGNTRPLSSKMVFTLLSTQNIISTVLVQDAHQCSASHARKICAVLRIASREFVKHSARGVWVVAGKPW